MNKTTININGQQVEIQENKQKHILFYRESFIQSLLSDLTSFAFVGITFWINYKYIGGNNFIDFFLLICIIALMSSKTVKHEFTSKQDLLEHINKEIKE